MAEILIVDDDENMCSAFRQFLQAEGHKPIIASSAEDAVKAVSEERPDLVFMDIRMPGVDGLEALKRIRMVDPEMYVVMMTAYSTSQTSIEAVRLGAFDYLNKPLDLDDVRHVINKALASRALSLKAAAKEESELERYSLVNLVGSSPRMQEIYRMIGLLTTNDVPVLVAGERGVGKQIVAQTIHFNSGRKDGPFVTVNCQSIQDADLEVFGRPAATGSPAVTGRLEKAAGGSLFLDEIQSLTSAAQNKLARFLKERSFEPAGGTDAVAIDVRVIGATSVNLADPAGLFNVDLYDSLRVITIELPPLRDRREDIPELVHHFIRRHKKELHKDIKGVDDRALGLLTEHNWPGNVAELENVIKRACILSRGDIVAVDDIQDALQGGVARQPAELQSKLEECVREKLQQALLASEDQRSPSVFYEIVTQVEASIVKEALRITGGNQVKAAELLGLNRTTLRKKMNVEGSGN